MTSVNFGEVPGKTRLTGLDLYASARVIATPSLLCCDNPVCVYELQTPDKNRGENCLWQFARQSSIANLFAKQKFRACQR